MPKSCGKNDRSNDQSQGKNREKSGKNLVEFADGISIAELGGSDRRDGFAHKPNLA
jgi:hypothetical protein